jgi:ribosome maturation factor RimP
LERIDDALYEMTNGLVEGMGYKLVTVEEVFDHGRRTFRFYIDHAQGISLGDCETVSREIAYLLEADLETEGGFVLEVSSPGLAHALKKEREYVHFAGREARLVLREPLDGSHVLTGVILGAGHGTVRLKMDGVELSIPLANIARARLEL